MQSVPSSSRQVGDTIAIYDTIGGQACPRFLWEGTIVQLTSKIVRVAYLGGEQKFNRVTGFQIGYYWPHQTKMIAPETSKE